MYIIIDNYDSFTYNIYQYLCELTNEPVQVFRNDKVSLQDIEHLRPRGILISPGPGRPEDAGISVAVLKHFAGKIPILGVCLGHQAIGYAFGGEIIGAKEIVHGKTQPITHDNRGIFRGLPQPCTFTRYHSLVINSANLPEHLIATAWSPDGEIMGIRHRDLPIEGVQFHPESIASEGGKQLLKNFLHYKLEPFLYKPLLNKVINGQDLTMEEAQSFMDELTSGNLSPVQIAGFLTALATKGPAAQEIAGCASVLQKKMAPLGVTAEYLDTCGTGGDEHGTFNISSFSALIASSCGAKVAKHGNRAVTSKSGSAEFFAALGLPLDLTPPQSRELLEKTDFAFLYAPTFHSAMRHAAPVRKELGVKTIMNLIGPLSNPARAAFQLIGIYSDDLAMAVAGAVHLLGVKRALIVHGLDGEDEISVTGPSHLYWVDEAGEVTKSFFDPTTIGIPLYPLEELIGGTAEVNAALAMELIKGEGRPAIRDAVCLNAGAALWVSGLCSGLEEGYALARGAIGQGRVAAQLETINEAIVKIRTGA